jgi:cytoskeleton protein RodZ
MITVGETLRRERLKRNLGLLEVSRELKISERFLEAIENEDFDKLPGGVFARAFVRQYAGLLGLNGDEMASQLSQSLEPLPAELPEPTRPTKTGLAPIQVPRMEEWQSVGDKGFRWSGSLSAGILVVIVMLVCSGVYAWMQRPRPAISQHTSTPPAQTAATTTPAQTATPPAAPAPSPEGATGPQATPATEPSPVAAAPLPVQQNPASNPASNPVGQPAAPAQPVTTPAPATTATATPNPDATVHLEVTATEPVWILARVDGKFAFTGTMEASQTRNLEATRDVVLRLGNAGGVNITLNGKPVGTVGPKGQPRTIQFTSGGFQIVPAAKPPSEPPAAPIDRL